MKLLKNNRGFTLIEVVIVMAIIGVISTMVAPQVVEQFNLIALKSDIQAAQSVENAIEMYNVNHADIDEENWTTAYDQLIDKEYLDAKDFKIVDEENGGKTTKLELRLDGNELIYSIDEGVQVRVNKEAYQDLEDKLDDNMKKWAVFELSAGEDE
ncbi:type II secretion system protein [Candidatus Epulonipiscium viviparus]|uniref:type II secretion system protein n=1 Tax=Candidatus Epulonipiscium viviparus TaxID=420336 RepID=UPI00016BFEE1|nr:type II secretion system protein [Candidatus Epulopiscium viviparus]